MDSPPFTEISALARAWLASSPKVMFIQYVPGSSKALLMVSKHSSATAMGSHTMLLETWHVGSETTVQTSVGRLGGEERIQPSQHAVCTQRSPRCQIYNIQWLLPQGSCQHWMLSVALTFPWQCFHSPNKPGAPTCALATKPVSPTQTHCTDAPVLYWCLFTENGGTRVTLIYFFIYISTHTPVYMYIYLYLCIYMPVDFV